MSSERLIMSLEPTSARAGPREVDDGGALKVKKALIGQRQPREWAENERSVDPL